MTRRGWELPVPDLFEAITRLQFAYVAHPTTLRLDSFELYGGMGCELRWRDSQGDAHGVIGSCETKERYWFIPAILAELAALRKSESRRKAA